MRVRDNWLSMLTWRNLSTASDGVDKSIARLSSGLYINVAADGAAELGVSERLRAQVRGLIQANRNAMDGISLVQTAESALDEVSNLLQRGRELSVQAANGTLSQNNKQSIQTEIDNLLSEIDRIADATTFNGTRLLSPTSNIGAISNVLNGLRSSWMQQTENLVQTYYGLVGDGATMKVSFESTGSDSAWISGTPNAGTGQLDNLTLHINLSQVGSVGGPDGGTAPIYDDRKVARAITQAIVARNVNYNALTALDPWFASGVADYIAGRNELLKSDISQYGAAAVVNAMNDALTGNWKDDSLHRSAAYAAVRWLQTQLAPQTLSDVMAALTPAGATLDSALNGTYGADVNTFINDFKVAGVAFLQSLNLDGPDVGGIGGGDAHQVIPNPVNYTLTPMAHLNVDWASLGSSGVGALLGTPMNFTLQVGANQGDTMDFSIQVISTFTLNLVGIDVTNHADQAINAFSNAIKQLSTARSELGSVDNRLERTVSNNDRTNISEQSSFSRIRDLDYAREVTTLARQQILVSSSGAMLAQANAMRQNVMWLLNGVSRGSGSMPAWG